VTAEKENRIIVADPKDSHFIAITLTSVIAEDGLRGDNFLYKKPTSRDRIADAAAGGRSDTKIISPSVFATHLK